MTERRNNEQNSENSNKKRILCIDSGGARGIFPASFLSSLDEKIDGDIAEYFDLIVGTSTGGIIALGLGLGIKPADLLSFYRDSAREVFGDGSKNFLYFLTSRGKYKTGKLRSLLHSILGDSLLGASMSRLAIPCWNSTSRCPHIYKTAHHSRYAYDHLSLALDVALATSAAPHYFSEHRTRDNHTLLDGGLFANNPLLVAVTEAIGVLGWDMDDLYVLSLGTGMEIRRKRKPWRLCFYGYLTYLIDQILDAQASASLAMGDWLLRDRSGLRARDRLFRITHSFAEGERDMDDTSNLYELEGLGKVRAREHLEELREVFFSHKAKPFVPEHKTKT